MAPKREKSLLEDPPAASSSEDEDVEEEVEDAEEEEVEEEEVDEEEEEEEDDEEAEEEEEDEVTPGKPVSSSVVKKPSSDAKPSFDEEEDESEESDSDPTPPKVKPLGLSNGGKPIVPKPKKTVSKPSTTINATPLASFTKPSVTGNGKRPLVSEKEDSKRKKKKVDDEEDEEDEEDSHPEESEKRSMFQRLWSEDDEIVILRKMVESIKKGVNPLADIRQFHESIKNSLHIEANSDQLINKIRRLKKKYQNNAKRGKGRDPVFSKAHEVLSHQLMKEIWGSGNEGNVKVGVSRVTNNGKDESVLANGKSMSEKLKNAATPVKIKTLSDISMKEASKMDERNGSLLHPCVQEMVHSRNVTMVGESFLKEGLGLIEDSKKDDLEQKWKSLHAAELKLYLRRVELVQEQTIAILDAYKSSDA